jgi:hypothetical protein
LAGIVTLFLAQSAIIFFFFVQCVSLLDNQEGKVFMLGPQVLSIKGYGEVLSLSSVPNGNSLLKKQK